MESKKGKRSRRISARIDWWDERGSEGGGAALYRGRDGRGSEPGGEAESTWAQ